jgi:hypothetical protein
MGGQPRLNVPGLPAPENLGRGASIGAEAVVFLAPAWHGEPGSAYVWAVPAAACLECWNELLQSSEPVPVFVPHSSCPSGPMTLMPTCETAIFSCEFPLLAPWLRLDCAGDCAWSFEPIVCPNTKVGDLLSPHY